MRERKIDGQELIITGRLGQYAEVGQVMGGIRTVLDPADSLWADLREAVAFYDSDQFATVPGRDGAGPRKRTRFDQGRLIGQMYGTAWALAMIIRGHDYLNGDAAERMIGFARQANRAEAVSDVAGHGQ